MAKIKYRSSDIWKQRYHNYIIRYNRAEKQLARKGYDMFDEKFSKREFISKFKDVFASERERMLDGESKTIGDVTRKIIEKQKFEGTYAQATKIQEAIRNLKDRGLIDERTKMPTTTEIRARENIDSIKDVLREQYHYLLSIGMTSKEAKHSVSQEFFGSM